MSSSKARPSSSGEPYTTSTSSASVAAEASETRIRRPSNAWLLFRTDTVKALRASAPPSARQPPQGELSKTIAAMWRAASAQVRAEYEARAAEEKRQHKIRWPGYRYQPTKAQRSLSTRERRADAASQIVDDGSRRTSPGATGADEAEAGTGRAFAGFRAEQLAPHAPPTAQAYQLPPTASHLHQTIPRNAFPLPPEPSRAYSYPGSGPSSHEFIDPHAHARWQSARLDLPQSTTYPNMFTPMTTQSPLPPLTYAPFDAFTQSPSGSGSLSRPNSAGASAYAHPAVRWHTSQSETQNFQGQPSGVAGQVVGSPEETWTVGQSGQSWAE